MTAAEQQPAVAAAFTRRGMSRVTATAMALTLAACHTPPESRQATPPSTSTGIVVATGRG